MNTPTVPSIKWAQRKERLFITIDLPNVKDISIDLTPEGRLKFKGSADKVYELDIELYKEVSKEESKFRTEARNVFLNIKKKEKGPYWPRLLKNAGKFQWLHVDWNMYVDEDEDDGDLDLGQNFNDFGNGPEDDDSDDKEDLSKNIEGEKPNNENGEKKPEKI